MRPVFIVGVPRSGTTLLGAILGTHPDCICTPESQFIMETMTSPVPERRLRSVITEERFTGWGPDRATWLDAVPSPGSYRDMLMVLVRRYAERTGRPNARVWIEHTPQHALRAAMLLELFPGARFIHIVRDGRGVAASVLPLTWGPNTVERAAHWWLELVAFGLALESWGRVPVIRVRYEDVVTEPERVIPEIAAFAGLDYSPAMLRADGYQPWDPTGQHALVGQPPHADRADGWRKTLSPRNVEVFEAIARDMLAYLEYETCFAVTARRPSAREHGWASIYERFRGFVTNPWRERRAHRHLRVTSDR